MNPFQMLAVNSGLQSQTSRIALVLIHPMNQVWDELDKLLASHAPKIAASLRPPASEEQIAIVEEQIGMQLPEDLRLSYLRHNGQEPDCKLFGVFEWVGLERMLELWLRWTDLYERVFVVDYDASCEKPTDMVSGRIWNRGWLPFGDPAGNYLLCVDTAPGQAGHLGQVIYWEVTDGALAKPYADSFHSYLERLITGLKNGEIQYIELGENRGYLSNPKLNNPFHPW